MKIAINKCFGGFDLSTEVFENLIQLGVPYYKSYDDIPKNSKEPYIVDSDMPSSAFGKYYSNFRDYEFRTHPLLIQAIEKSKEPSGRFGDIQVIEIPDGIDYQIDDYDGIETVHEKHRSW